MIAFVLGFVALAIFNLTNFSTLTTFGVFAAIAWLALVAAVIWMFIHVDGVRKFRVDFLGHYSRQHFVEAAQHQDGSTTICLGYHLFKRNWYYWNVKTSFIVSVNWSAGQATGMTGRDMKDWSVWMWYRDPDKPERSTEFSPRANYDLYLVGPTRARDQTEQLGHQFVEFLRSAGLDMVATEKDTKFNVRGKSMPGYQNADVDSDGQTPGDALDPSTNTHG